MREYINDRIILTIIGIYQILLDLGIIIVLVGIACRCTRHHGHERS